MMALRIKKETRLGPEYEIVFDYDNPYEQQLHSLMMGVESMMNCVLSGPVTKPQVHGYNADIPEFIPGCCCQTIMFEMVFTPYGGNHINTMMRHPNWLYPINGMISPTDFIELCKYKVLTRLLFDEYDFIEFQCKNAQEQFNELRNWIYTKFGYNARNKIWANFESKVAEEIRRKYPTQEDFAAYVKKAAERSLKESGITPDMSYYNDRLKDRIRRYNKGADKFYQE